MHVLCCFVTQPIMKFAKSVTATGTLTLQHLLKAFALVKCMLSSRSWLSSVWSAIELVPPSAPYEKNRPDILQLGFGVRVRVAYVRAVQRIPTADSRRRQ